MYVYKISIWSHKRPLCQVSPAGPRLISWDGRGKYVANFHGLPRSLLPSMVVSLASFGKNSQNRTLPVLVAVAVASFVASILHPHTRPLAAPFHSGPIRGACVLPQLVLNLTPSSKNRVGEASVTSPSSSPPLTHKSSLFV